MPTEDEIADALADQLTELAITGDPLTRRAITNAIRLQEGLEPYAPTIGRKRLAQHFGTTVRDIRETEERAIEKLRLALSKFITPQHP